MRKNNLISMIGISSLLALASGCANYQKPSVESVNMDNAYPNPADKLSPEKKAVYDALLEGAKRNFTEAFEKWAENPVNFYD